MLVECMAYYSWEYQEHERRTAKAREDARRQTEGDGQTFNPS